MLRESVCGGGRSTKHIGNIEKYARLFNIIGDIRISLVYRRLMRTSEALIRLFNQGLRQPHIFCDVAHFTLNSAFSLLYGLSCKQNELGLFW